MTRSSSASRAVRKIDRHEIAVGAQPAADLEAVDVGQHHVEHDDVGWRARAASSAGMPVPRGGDLVAHVAQGRDSRSVMDDSSSTTSTRDGVVPAGASVGRLWITVRDSCRHVAATITSRFSGRFL